MCQLNGYYVTLLLSISWLNLEVLGLNVVYDIQL